MDIDQSQTLSRQSIFFQKSHDFIVVCLNGWRKRPQQGQNFISVPYYAASQLSGHQTVTNDFTSYEHRLQPTMSVPQVFDP
jgi:hypothetical protein